MKVVALVSGGKDSCYAMQRCIHYGHEIVALANLLPADDEVDELDSFMFQTVGHQMICAIAQCMGLPLFRRRIQGSSRLQELRYKKTVGDEVEDLEKLLMAVKQKYPDIGGVSSGAIASNYQRLRVESICSRLGLISLAYLWEQEQAALLQNMIDSGIHAVLVKVAAIGMDPQKHLGKDLASVQPHLARLASLYGSNVCGEGGEYESLTLNSPLFKHARIVLDDFEVTLHSPDQIAPVGVLHPTKFHLEFKDASSANLNPDLLSSVIEVTDNKSMEETVMCGEDLAAIGSANIDKVQLTVMSPHCGVVTMGCWRQQCDKLGVREELGLLLSTVEKSLQSKGLTWGNVVYVRLFLDDMASFGSANEVYVKHITEQKCEKGVPSRCCMQVCLPEADMGGVLLEVTATSDSSKQVLHVQSISCWAPSCIGPYSQATLHRNVLHMAGQLGLDPPTMALVQGGATVEMQQALKNCEAVAGAFKASVRRDAVAITVYCSNALTVKDQAQVECCLLEFLEEDAEDGGTYVRPNSKIPDPLILFVLVPALPKGAYVEVEPSLFVNSGEDDAETFSSSSWQHVHVDPRTDPDKLSNASEALQTSETNKRTLMCTPCKGLILPGRYCRAILCIRDISVECSGNKLVDLKELRDRVVEAIAILKSNVYDGPARLSWSNITVFRVYYDAKAIGAADLRATLAEALEGAEVYPTLVPVCGASSTLKSRELVVIDVTGAGAHHQP